MEQRPKPYSRGRRPSPVDFAPAPAGSAATAAYADDDVRRRLAVKPGMTGLWQVSGRSDLPWEEAVRLDLRYVENWSLFMDLVIMLRTLTAVARSAGAY